MAASMAEFDVWLGVKLKSYSTEIDEVVFGDYIKGILEVKNLKMKKSKHWKEFWKRYHL